MDDGWKVVRFGEVVRQVKDKVSPAESGLDRYIAGDHMDSDGLRLRRWGEINGDYLGPAFHMRFRPGQVLYGSRRTYLRKAATADFEGICANTTFVLESSDPTVLLPELLPFVVTTEAFHAHSVKQSKGSVNPYVNFSDLAWYEFALPPLEEQQRIARLLSKAWELEDGLFLASESAGRLHESLSISLFRDAAEGAAVEPLSVLCEKLSVGIVVRPADHYTDSPDGVPALIMKNVQRGWLDLSELNRITPEGHALHAKSTLRTGDVVAVRSSGSEGRTGDAAVVPATLDGGNCIDVLHIRPGPRLVPGFLCAYLNSPATRIRLLAGSTGTMQKHLNVGALKHLAVPVPTTSRQREIHEQLDDVATAIAAVSGRRDRARANRKALSTIALSK